jgi:hypothetical protein
MNLTEGRLRAALLETAEQIPPGAVPPLNLPSDDLPQVRAGRLRPGGQPRRWLPALAAAAAVCLTIGLSVTLAGAGGTRPRAPIGPQAASYLAQFPPYNVALQRRCFIFICASGGSGNNTPPDRAVVRSTLTGSTLAAIDVPKPYATFAFVQGTADGRVFILGAQRLSAVNPPPTKLYLLRLNPSAPAGKQAQLTALHVPLLPTGTGNELGWFALSPNGHLLATISTKTANNIPTQLQVFDLVTGRSRTWVLPVWAGGLDAYVDVTGPPTWGTDSRTLAFFSRSKAGSPDLVLLDTSAPAASFGADTRSVPLPGPQRGEEITYGPDSPLLTPDGQHVIEGLLNLREAAHPPGGPLYAFALDIVNIRTGAVTRLRQHILMPFVLASDPSGSAVIAAIGGLPPGAAGIVVWTAHGTAPIQVPAHAIAVAW